MTSRRDASPVVRGQQDRKSRSSASKLGGIRSGCLPTRRSCATARALLPSMSAHLRQGIRRSRQAALRHRPCRALVRRQGIQGTLVDLRNTAVATQEELKASVRRRPHAPRSQPRRHPAALYVGQIKNYAGQPIAVLEVIKDTTEYEAAATSSQRNLIYTTLAILAGAATAGVPAPAAACRVR